MKQTAEGELAKMRVEIDVSPWWWRTAHITAERAGASFSIVFTSVPRIWRVTATTTFLSVSANLTPDVTLEGLDKKRQEIVRALDALVPRTGP
jgi:hypothetical protein